MITLTEQIYEYLLEKGKLVSTFDVINSEQFSHVPPMVVGQGLLTICGEGLANYYMEDGKMFFTTDLSIGRGPIGSQNNLGNLSALSALFGGARNGIENLFASTSKIFPEIGEAKSDDLLNALSFTDTLRGDDFEIAFPSNPSEVNRNEGDHEFVVNYEKGPINMTTRFLAINGENSEIKIRTFCRAQCKELIKKLYKDIDEPEEYKNESIVAFYVPAYENSFAFVGRPDGIHMIRVDWEFEEGLPSKKVVVAFIEKWLNSYKYLGEKQYTKLMPLDRKELLQLPLSGGNEESILEEYETYLNEAKGIVNIIGNSVGTQNGIDKPTIFFCRARKSLEEAAEFVDAIIMQATNVIKFYAENKENEAFLDKLYSLAQITLDVASSIEASIKINVSNIPYNSPTDIAFGANSTEDKTVQVFPSHYLEFLDLVISLKMESQELDDNLKTSINAFAKEMKARYETANKSTDYYPEFKIEGKMVAAYLGHSKKVEVPEFISRIGDYAFKNAKEVEAIVLGENVTSMGFSPFAGCSNLRLITVLGDIASIQGPLTGFASSRKLTIQSYRGSYIEKYCKENELTFEPLAEDDLDCIIELNDKDYDTYQGFALPKISGFKTTKELNDAEVSELKANENTAHIQYGMVPNGKSFSEYQDTFFSVTSVQDPLDIPQGGLQIAKEIEQRFNQPTLHSVYKTVTADNGNVLVRYDTTREGNDDGIQWATYVLVVAREDKLLIMQIFINGDYTHRQQQFAIEKWASHILTEKAYEEVKSKKATEEKKKLEAKEKKASEARRKEEERLAEEERKKQEEKEVREWEEKKKQILETIEKKKKDYLKTGDEELEKKKRALIEKKENDINVAKQEIAAIQKEKADAESELPTLGLFKFGRKKELRQLLAGIPSRIADKESLIQKIASDFEVAKQKAERDWDSKKNERFKQIEIENPIPEHPLEEKMKKERKKNQHDRILNQLSQNQGSTATQAANQAYKLAIYEYLASKGSGFMVTIPELLEVVPEVSDLSNQRVSALVRQLCDERILNREEIKRIAYFSLNEEF